MKDVKSQLYVTEIVNKLNEDQFDEYIRINSSIDVFAIEMKIRFLEKMIEGKKGWDNNTFNIPQEITDRAKRLHNGEQKADIGIANWAFINWFNR